AGDYKASNGSNGANGANGTHSANGAADHRAESGNGGEFRYSDTLVGEPNPAPQAASPMAEAVFSGTGNLPSDTMSRVLRDELEGIDFYIAQGYLEIAQDTLDRLHAEYGDHPEVLARYKRMGLNVESRAASVPAPELEAMPEVLPVDEQAQASAPVGTTFFEGM